MMLTICDVIVASVEKQRGSGPGSTLHAGSADSAKSYFRGFKDMIDWITGDLRTMLLVRVQQQPQPLLQLLLEDSAGPTKAASVAATERTTRIRKRVIFYLECLLLSKRDSQVFRSKCDRDLHRVLPLSRFHSGLVVATVLAMDVLMLTLVVDFAKSADMDTRAAWVLTAVFSLTLDWAVMETAQVLLTHVLVPHCIAAEIRRSVLLLARLAVSSAPEASSWGAWFESVRQPTLMDGVIVRFMRLPLAVQDSAAYALVGGGFATLVLLSAELFRLFPPLALAPWTALCIAGYMLRQLVGSGRRRGSTVAAVKPLIESSEEASSSAAFASSPSSSRRNVKKPESEVITDSILRDRSAGSHSGRAVVDYNFRFEDYRKKHAVAAGRSKSEEGGGGIGIPGASIEEQKASSSLPVSRFHRDGGASRNHSQSIEYSSVEHKDDAYALVDNELDNDQVRSPDNLYVDFYHVREDDESENSAMQSQLYHPPKEDADSHSEDGRFGFDRYDSDSSGNFI